MLQVNNSFLIHGITSRAQPSQYKPPLRQKTLPSAVVLLHNLPTLSTLTTNALKLAKEARYNHILQESINTALETPLDARPAADPPKYHSSHSGRNASSSSDGGRKGSAKGSKPDGSFEMFQVMRAVEKKDIMLLMEVKSQQFDLLVQAVGGNTPLLHAMRLGKSHRDIAILLTGAISRRVNDVSDNELDRMDPSTRSLLRAIRANLKVAISYGIQSSQTDLISSYLQVIVMSEGDRFIHESTNKVALALRAGAVGKPVASAGKVIDKWVSKELKEKEVASVGEYVANATADLVLLGLWSIATDTVVGDTIPTYYFCRDDRIAKTLEEHLEEMKRAGSYTRLSKSIRKQLETSLQICLMRNVGGRERVDMLRAALDDA
ncbi:hypothetical protein T439DRAFT_323439 [Meredithblackwellia eburnea MCA 4105]